MSHPPDDDPRAWLREAFPSHGPAWDEAVAFGIDVALLEENLRLTPSERLDALQAMLEVVGELRGAASRARDDAEPS